jgi:hypothetical protein
VPEIYEAIAERFNRPLAPPESEWLEAAYDAFAGADEFILSRLVDLTGDAHELTYEELGRLLYWADAMRLALETAAEKVDTIREQALSTHIADAVAS